MTIKAPNPNDGPARGPTTPASLSERLREASERIVSAALLVGNHKTDAELAYAMFQRGAGWAINALTAPPSDVPKAKPALVEKLLGEYDERHEYGTRVTEADCHFEDACLVQLLRRQIDALSAPPSDAEVEAPCIARFQGTATPWERLRRTDVPTVEIMRCEARRMLEAAVAVRSSAANTCTREAPAQVAKGAPGERR